MCRETWRTTPSALCALTQDHPALLIFCFLRGDLTYFRYSSQLALLSLSLFRIPDIPSLPSLPSLPSP